MNESFSLGRDVFWVVAAYVVLILNFLVVVRKGRYRALIVPSIVWLLVAGVFAWFRFVYVPHLFGNGADAASARSLWFRLFTPVLLQSLFAFSFALMGRMVEDHKTPFTLGVAAFTLLSLASFALFALVFFGIVPT